MEKSFSINKLLVAGYLIGKSQLITVRLWLWSSKLLATVCTVLHKIDGKEIGRFISVMIVILL